MPSPKSQTLDNHFKNKKKDLSHLEYLDRILGSIHPVHFEKVLWMRKDIELALLNNPESKNSVVAYLSWVNDKIQNIELNHKKVVQEQVEVFSYA